MTRTLWPVCECVQENASAYTQLKHHNRASFTRTTSVAAIIHTRTLRTAGNWCCVFYWISFYDHIRHQVYLYGITRFIPRRISEASIATCPDDDGTLTQRTCTCISCVLLYNMNILPFKTKPRARVVTDGKIKRNV